MPFTREHGVLRILIGCLDQSHIPDKMNVFIVDGFYELTFEIEVPEGDPMLEDNTSAENVPSNGDKKQGNDGHGQSEDAFEKPHGKKCFNLNGSYY
jgi:hypothetical protein